MEQTRRSALLEREHRPESKQQQQRRRGRDDNRAEDRDYQEKVVGGREPLVQRGIVAGALSRQREVAEE